MKTAFWSTLALIAATGCGGSNTDYGGAGGNGSGNASGAGSGNGSSSGSGSGNGSSASSGSGNGSSSGNVSSSGAGSSSGGNGSTSSSSSGASSSGGVIGSSGIQILVMPNGNHMAEIIAAVSGATTSVYMTMYMIDDTALINAIVARKSAGLDVQVVLDGSSTTKSSNTNAYDAFSSAGIPVVWSSSSFTYTHEKCIMIDHKQAWIMTMNAETSVPQYNREYIAIDNDQGDVVEAEQIFVADHAMKSISPVGNLVVAPTNARADLVKLINSATKSLDVEDEEFSDAYSTGITNAVVAAAKRGVKVRVIVAGGSTVSGQTTALNQVKSAGGSVFVSDVASGAGSASDPYLHAKAIVVDCSTGTCAGGFVGSENMTGGSLGYNRELGVIITDAAQLALVYTAMSTDFNNPKDTKL